MADVTIPGLTTQLTSVDRAADLLEVSDTSDAGNSKKSSVNNLLDLTTHPVGVDDIQTLTNKTITAPTISSPVLSGTVTGTYTIGGTPTFPSAVATLTGSQTLTNKVLTSPTINSPTITNPTITVDTISEFTAANGVTIDGLNIKDSKLNTNDSVVTANITNASVTAPKLANSGAWGSDWALTSWTPTWANITVGNGTVNAKYTQIGKTVHFRIIFTLGTTSVIGTLPTFTLPVTSIATPNTLFPLGEAIYDNNGGSGFKMQFVWASTTTAALKYWDSNNNIISVSATAPASYANNYKIYGQGTYEAA
jgi:hypothetical protein